MQSIRSRNRFHSYLIHKVHKSKGRLAKLMKAHHKRYVASCTRLCIAGRVHFPCFTAHFMFVFGCDLHFQIKRIDIQFARRAKVIDMKQMKRKCMETIDRQREKTSNRTITHPEARNDETYKDGAASFGLIYTTLPHVLTKTMAENLSPSIAFYSILHLANEHRFRLYKSTRENDMNVFLIRQLD